MDHDCSYSMFPPITPPVVNSTDYPPPSHTPFSTFPVHHPPSLLQFLSSYPPSLRFRQPRCWVWARASWMGEGVASGADCPLRRVRGSRDRCSGGCSGARSSHVSKDAWFQARINAVATTSHIHQECRRLLYHPRLCTTSLTSTRRANSVCLYESASVRWLVNIARVHASLSC